MIIKIALLAIVVAGVAASGSNRHIVPDLRSSFERDCATSYEWTGVWEDSQSIFNECGYAGYDGGEDGCDIDMSR